MPTTTKRSAAGRARPPRGTPEAPPSLRAVASAVAAPSADVAAVAVGLYTGRKLAAGPSTEAALGGVDLASLALLGFEGRSGETATLTPPGGPAVIAVGLGSPPELTLAGLRRAAAACVRAAWKAQSVALALVEAAPNGLSPGLAAQAVTEAALLASYRFTRYKNDPQACRLERIEILGRGVRVARGVEKGAVIAGAVAFARDLINEPPGTLTPTRLGEIATELARSHPPLRCEVMDEARIERERLGGLRGVSLGSAQPPRLIRLTYNPPDARRSVVIVGKGITFDSGGLSLKTAEGMKTMKHDMSGAAAVLAIMSVLARLRPRVKVVAVAPATENLPGGRAIKPGDILRIRNGKTVEVLNTDAEGRLVLADGLSLAAEERPDAIVDLATLTGACVIALGKRIAGVMGNDDAWVAEVRAAAERAGEPAWPLPLPDEYRRDIESGVADIRNIGEGGTAGAIAGGMFLKEFVGSVPWAHLDIAGPAWVDADDGELARGATGTGVRTIVELLTAGTIPRARHSAAARR